MHGAAARRVGHREVPDDILSSPCAPCGAVLRIALRANGAHSGMSSSSIPRVSCTHLSTKYTETTAEAA